MIITEQVENLREYKYSSFICDNTVEIETGPNAFLRDDAE